MTPNKIKHERYIDKEDAITVYKVLSLDNYTGNSSRVYKLGKSYDAFIRYSRLCTSDKVLDDDLYGELFYTHISDAIILDPYYCSPINNDMYDYKIAIVKAWGYLSGDSSALFVSDKRVNPVYATRFEIEGFVDDPKAAMKNDLDSRTTKFWRLLASSKRDIKIFSDPYFLTTYKDKLDWRYGIPYIAPDLLAAGVLKPEGEMSDLVIDTMRFTHSDILFDLFDLSATDFAALSPFLNFSQKGIMKIKENVFCNVYLQQIGYRLKDIFVYDEWPNLMLDWLNLPVIKESFKLHPERTEILYYIMARIMPLSKTVIDIFKDKINWNDAVSQNSSMTYELFQYLRHVVDPDVGMTGDKCSVIYNRYIRTEEILKFLNNGYIPAKHIYCAACNMLNFPIELVQAHKSLIDSDKVFDTVTDNNTSLNDAFVQKYWFRFTKSQWHNIVSTVQLSEETIEKYLSFMSIDDVIAHQPVSVEWIKKYIYAINPYDIITNPFLSIDDISELGPRYEKLLTQHIVHCMKRRIDSKEFWQYRHKIKDVDETIFDIDVLICLLPDIRVPFELLDLLYYEGYYVNNFFTVKCKQLYHKLLSFDYNRIDSGESYFYHMYATKYATDTEYVNKLDKKLNSVLNIDTSTDTLSFRDKLKMLYEKYR